MYQGPSALRLPTIFVYARRGDPENILGQKHCEMYNEIEGNFEDVVISTFKSGLPVEHGLRKSLTGKPVTSLRQLMDRIDKSDRLNNNQPRRDFTGQSRSTNTQIVNAVFRESVHQGHTTEDCRNLWDHLAQLVREGKLKQLLHHSSGQVGQSGLDPRRDSSSRPPLGTINVIFAVPGRTGSCPSRVMSVARLSTEDSNSEPKRARIEAPLVLGFLANDKIGTIQPHDDALVVTLKTGGYDVKRLLVDQGSAIEIMYLDLYKGLNLKPKDLTAYDSPLVSFEGKTVTPRG
ncbi:uncharacterized protein LOC126728746 [Quercus robur]|uniref:uncharacterized protein LOC126728746 n=1 Tax=Quercus robur TaxID=38942 RepID=UPI002161B8CC|nr:uncharacterized protein LOC126728746 [Quercus robur]